MHIVYDMNIQDRGAEGVLKARNPGGEPHEASLDRYLLEYMSPVRSDSLRMRGSEAQAHIFTTSAQDDICFLYQFAVI